MADEQTQQQAPASNQPAQPAQSESKLDGLRDAIKAELDKGGRFLVQHGAEVLPFKHLHPDKYDETRVPTVPENQQS